MKYNIKEVYVDPSVRNLPFVVKAIRRLGKEYGREGVCSGDLSLGEKEDLLAKDRVYFVSYPGEVLKPCPGTTEHICCGYQILNIGTNCPMDCSYCILQSYFNQPGVRIFGNIEQRLQDVFGVIDAFNDRIFRVGTGEFTDSLALDPVVGWTELLVPEFSRRRNAVLELKTKTDHVERLLRIGVRDRIIVSWSLNAAEIVFHEEHGAASLKKRLEAARRCQEEGYVLGFHFDPLIYYPGWREDYLRTLELMDKLLEPKGIIWISLGSFRFMPQLKYIIWRRHPRSIVTKGEFVPGRDGKMRYFKPIRVELYSFMREQLEQWSQDLGLYLCMESPDIWETSMGWNPGNTESLSAYLDERVRKIFG
ncbi:MAG TPA: DNA photolyase [Desulfobacterales bacterium]|nr:DNA photolyase [Desulfobacterales bacterium]